MKIEIPDPWEEKLATTAAAFTYPATPDVREVVHKRLAGRTTRQANRRLQLAWAALIIVFVLASLWAVPGVRAQITEFIQIGIVRIFPAAPTPTPTASLPTVTYLPPPTATPPPSPTPVPVIALLNLAGETTLETARQEVKFPIRLPSYPPDLGQPEHVFLQSYIGQLVLLAWADPAQPARVRLSLQMITGSYYIEKFEPKIIQETLVKGQRAVWTEGPHLFLLQNGNDTLRQIVEGNTLIWVEGDITYRLETALSMDEAIKIAESLK